jgi:hypothetical protein
MIDALTTVDVAAIYNIISSCFFCGVSTGDEMRYTLRLSKASLASYIHSNLHVFFNSLKKGSSFSSTHEMKQLRAAMLPISFCTSFTQRGGPISVMD